MLVKQRALDYDAIITGARGNYYGQPLVPLIKRMTKKPVIFDAFLTLYETYVIDRKTVSSKSPKARLFYKLDYDALHKADLILTDTKEHMKYFSSLYDIEPSKFSRILLGTDTDLFYPRSANSNNYFFNVNFWGNYIPLQGVKYILDAANILKNHSNIRFNLLGYGQTFEEIYSNYRKLGIRNVYFHKNKLPYSELPSFISSSDVCLGIFGETQKAQRVIPNKAIESIAMGKPLITGESPAIKEFFIKNENAILIPMANPEALASSILLLKENKELRDKMAYNGFKLFNKYFSTKSIGEQLRKVLERLIYN